MVTREDRRGASAQFLADNGWHTDTRIRIAGDASNRAYDRLTRPNGRTAILMDAPPETGEDVRPFIRMATYLRQNGLSAPDILAADETAGFLLLEDLGDALFADLMNNDPTLQSKLYKASVDVLIALHGAEPLPLPACDAAWLTEMTEPLFDWYLPEPAADLRHAFKEAFAPFAGLLAAEPSVTILRDYHAQNLLWLPDRAGVAKVGILDFQDALDGHRAYDLVSILQDARRDVPVSIEADVLKYFLEHADVDPDGFRRAYAVLGVQRNLRILGIFARLAKRDGKPSYVDLVPRVWNYVKRNLAHPDLVPLANVLEPMPAPTPAFLEQLKST